MRAKICDFPTSMCQSLTIKQNKKLKRKYMVKAIKNQICTHTIKKQAQSKYMKTNNCPTNPQNTLGRFRQSTIIILSIFDFKPDDLYQKFCPRDIYLPRIVVLCKSPSCCIPQKSASRTLLIHHGLRGYLVRHSFTFARDRFTFICTDLSTSATMQHTEKTCETGEI